MTDHAKDKPVAHSQADITRGSLIAKNTLWNTIGLILPLVVGLFAMPFLVHGLGTERFGVLTIAWMVIGYFSIFDFGLGRALTKLVAEKLGEKDHQTIPSLIWTAMAMMGFAGVMGSVVVALLAEQMVYSWLNIGEAFQPESLITFFILAVSIPFVIATTAFRGVLEAYQKFAVINLIRIPLGLWNFLGPLLVLPFSTSLDMIAMALLAGRIAGAYAYYHYCMKTVPELKAAFAIDKKAVRPLLSFGGWMTLSNVIGPLMVYMDRFLIGSVLTMTAVSYYVAPYEMVTRLWMIPMGLIGVLFPAFSTMLSSDKTRASRYYAHALNLIFFAMLPLFLLINTFAFEGMDIWLGHEFAVNSTMVLQLLAIGVFINCISRMPFVLIQSAGRPDIPAKLHLVELPFYLLGLWFALQYAGIQGAAFIWMLRVLVDAIAFVLIAAKVVPETENSGSQVLLMLAFGVLGLWMVTLIGSIVVKSVVLAVILPAVAWFAWSKVLNDSDRQKILSKVSIK